jgi:6-pyruvoyltetrahydropterin/6-carboxytetrahydropterin synthase
MEAPVQVTSRYRFAAAHRLDTPVLSAEENRKLYGKCNNPFGHGHDYILDVTVEGPVDAHGLVVNRADFDAVVRGSVLKKLDHKNLNVDLAEFANTVPTTENLATVVRDFLTAAWTLPVKLVRVRISETERNTFVWDAGMRKAGHEEK